MSYFVPKRSKAKVDMRWRVGIFLGRAERSNEAFVSTASGSVVKFRAITRVVHASKWDLNTLFKIVGTPAPMCPNPNGNRDPAWIGDEDGPHLHEFDKEINALAEEAIPPKAKTDSPNVDSAGQDLRNLPRDTIMQEDFVKRGFTAGCPRCRDLQGGRIHTQANNSE